MTRRCTLRCAFSFLSLLAVALLLQIPSLIPSAIEHSQLSTEQPSKGNLFTAYGKLPLHFELNQGQADPQVKFLARGPGYTLFLTRTEAVLALRHSGAEDQDPKTINLEEAEYSARRGQPADYWRNVLDEPSIETTVLRMRLIGANLEPRITGLDPLPGKSNYFLGNDPSKWRTNVPHYARVRYEEVYPGIDLVYYGTNQSKRNGDPARPELGRRASSAGRQLEYDFVVAPGADPASIRLRFAGADKLTLDTDGNLTLHVAGGDVALQAPLIYQEINGARETVPGHYVLRDPSEIGFQIAEYNPRSPLIIDPALVYSTFLGGSSFDAGRGITVDGAGNAFVTGDALSPDFPTTPGAFQPSGSGAFITKMNPMGSALLYSTYLGGSSLVNSSRAIAIDAAGNAYVTGFTRSTDFPITPGAFQTVLQGIENVFVTKLNPAGSGLVYSTYLGGTRFDQGFGIAVDTTGSAYVTGDAESPDFPTANAIQPNFLGGIKDAFLAKFDAAGNLLYSTYLGTSGGDAGLAVAVDASGNPHVAGFTGSNAAVFKLSTDGSALLYAVTLGGTGAANAIGAGVAVDAVGNAYVTGDTTFTDFPITVNAFQDVKNGIQDAFVLKLDPSGSLVFSTFLGGSGQEDAKGIAVDATGSAYVTGWTLSTDFPLLDSLQPQFAAFREVFVTKLNPSGSALVYSSYFVGRSRDEGAAIAVDSTGNAYVTGIASIDFPTTPGVVQPIFGGSNGEAFVAKISTTGPTLDLLSPPNAMTLGASFSLVVNGSSFTPDSIIQWNGNDRVTTFVNSTELQAFIPDSDIALTGTARVRVFNPLAPPGASNELIFTIESPAPTITSLIPTSARVGRTSFFLTVDGSGFVPPGIGFIPSSVVRWNGSDLNTFFISSTELRAFVSFAEIEQLGPVEVSVFNPAPGGGTSNALTFHVVADNPVPVITSISPDSTLVGGPGFTLTVRGANFAPGTVVRWNGNDRTTGFGGNILSAFIPRSDIAVAGTASVTVFAPGLGGGTSNAFTFTIIGNPVPSITGLVPDQVPAGAPAFTLTVNGTGFVSASVVRLNGVDRTTTFVSSTQLTADILAPDVATVGIATVTVFNPAPGGGTSNARTFIINFRNPLPTTRILSPSGAVAGGGAFTLIMTGANFVFNSVVQWDGSARTTTFVNKMQLLASISAADIAVMGTANVTVSSPTPGGGISNPLTFTVTAVVNAVPAVSSISPGNVTAGQARTSLTLTVNGSGFLPGSLVLLNGSEQVTTFASAIQLQATIPASDLTVARDIQLTVFNPGPGGGTSNSVTFSVQNPVPTLAGLSPADAPAGGGDFTLTASGSEFVPASVVRWNGSDRPTTFVSDSELRAGITSVDVRGPLAFVATREEDTLSMVDPRTHTIVATVPVGTLPAGVALTPDGGFAYVTSGGMVAIPTNTVSVINTATNTVLDTITVGLNPWGLAVTPDGQSVYVVNRGDGTVSVIDTATNTVVATIPVGVMPVAIAIRPDGSFGYVTNRNSAEVSVLDIATNTVVAAIPVQPLPTGIVITPDGGSAYVANQVGIAVINLTSNAVVQDIVIGVTDAIAIAPDGAFVYAVDLLRDLMLVIDTSTNMQVDFIGGIGDGVFSLAVTPDSRFVYAGSFLDSRVRVIDASTRTIVRTVVFAGGPCCEQGITFNSGAGTADVTVFTPGPGGGESAPLTFTINAGTNSLPAITSLFPISAPAGRAGFTLTVNGTGFTFDSVVRWDGTDRTTTFLSLTQVQAWILATDVATGGTPAVTVFNPTPGGGESTSSSFTVNNPVPTAAGLSPMAVLAGGGNFTLTVTGSNFVPGSVVRVDGADRATTFVNKSQLQATLLAADIAMVGMKTITVFNSTPAGGTSSALMLAISSTANPMPTIASLSPNTATAGEAAFTLTVDGGNFVPGAVVRWNGVNRPTTFVSAIQLTASISADDIARAGTADVTVVNPPLGGGTSNAATFTISP